MITKEKDKIKELEETIYQALNNKNSNNKLYLGKIDLKIAKKIEKLIGFNVENRYHLLYDSDIRHMINNHGQEKIEKLRNQEAITIEDLKSITNILINPDNIIKGNKNISGVSIKYLKSNKKTTICLVEIIPIKSKKMQIKTMWKISSASVHASNLNLTPHHTSQTKSKQSISTSINNISQLNNKCNEPLKEEELKTLKGGIKFIKELYSKINICYNFI